MRVLGGQPGNPGRHNRSGEVRWSSTFRAPSRPTYPPRVAAPADEYRAYLRPVLSNAACRTAPPEAPTARCGHGGFEHTIAVREALCEHGTAVVHTYHGRISTPAIECEDQKLLPDNEFGNESSTAAHRRGFDSPTPRPCDTRYVRCHVTSIDFCKLIPNEVATISTQEFLARRAAGGGSAHRKQRRIGADERRLTNALAAATVRRRRCTATGSW